MNKKFQMPAKGFNTGFHCLKCGSYWVYAQLTRMLGLSVMLVCRKCGNWQEFEVSLLSDIFEFRTKHEQVLKNE